VSSLQLVASIVSSYTTTTVRELNDNSYSLYLDDLATDLYSSFHRSLHHSSSVIIVHLDSSHARDVVIMWVLFSLVTIMMLVDRFMRRDRVRSSGDDGDDYSWWQWRLVGWWRCRFSQWWRRWLARLMRFLVMVQTDSNNFKAKIAKKRVFDLKKKKKLIIKDKKIRRENLCTQLCAENKLFSIDFRVLKLHASKIDFLIKIINC
jgi:hypothetical protein